MPPTSILPVSSSDLPTVGRFLYSQKLALTVNRLLFKDWPNEAAQMPVYTSAVEGGLKDPSTEGLKVIDDESREIVGYIALTRRRPVKQEPPTVQGNGDAKQNIPEFFNPDVLSMVLTAVNEINKEIEGIDHFGSVLSIYKLSVANGVAEVTYIAVRPSHRRQGIGRQLVQICFDRAKAEGLPLAVSSEPAAYDFFVNLGFKDTKHADFDLSKFAPANSGFGIFRLSGMIWSP